MNQSAGEELRLKALKGIKYRGEKYDDDCPFPDYFEYYFNIEEKAFCFIKLGDSLGGGQSAINIHVGEIVDLGEGKIQIIYLWRQITVLNSNWDDVKDELSYKNRELVLSNTIKLNNLDLLRTD